MKPGIAIVGGGVAGLITAVALLKRGVQATVFEQHNAHYKRSGCVMLDASSIAMLQQLGLWRSLQMHVHNLQRNEVYNAKGQRLYNTKRNMHTCLLELRQLQRVLQEALNPQQLQFGKQCVHINREDSNAAMLYFSDGTYVAARAVIAADGMHSFIRRSYFEEAPALYAGHVAWYGFAAGRQHLFANDMVYEFAGNGKRFRMLALPGNRLYWYATANMTEAKAACMQARHQYLLACFGNWCSAVTSVISATPQEQLQLVDTCFSQQVTKLVNRQLALTGDAAHPILHHDLAQGILQTLEDALLLAAAISTHTSVEKALHCYEAGRLKRVQSAATASFRKQKRLSGNALYGRLRMHLRMLL